MTKIILKAFSETFGIIMTLIGVIIGLFAFYVDASSTISVKVVLPMLLFLLYVLIVLFRSIHISINTLFLPEIIKSIKPFSPYDNMYDTLILLAPYSLFTYNTYVALYRLNNEVEELVGFGKVINVQEDKKLMLGFEISSMKEGLIESIIENNSDVINNLIIKPKGEVME